MWKRNRSRRPVLASERMGGSERPASSPAMARYKPIDTQPWFLPVDLAADLLPGTVEHALHHVREHAIDLTPFDVR